jgi:S-methylmethionine-dependent homocysteine/selenocysteine methylase
MSYERAQRLLHNGGTLILDGGTGTELERRGVTMNPEAWCGMASLESVGILEEIHKDYISAGADIITANTYCSSRLLLEPAGYGNQFEEINYAAIDAAQRARDASGREEVLIAGSLSHRGAITSGTAKPDLAQAPSDGEMADAFGELAALLHARGCDLILLEMMYDPERMVHAFSAAMESGLPVWAGLSARRGDDGKILSFAPDRDILFDDIIQILRDHNVAAAGIMHTQANVVGDALAILDGVFKGPLLAYPDSGYFKSPNWQFEDVMPPSELRRYADEWVSNRLQIVGGCCGLTPDHIAALSTLKQKVSA